MLYQFDELAFFICLAALAVLLIVLRFQKRSFSYLLFFLIFGVYLIGVVNVVIFPIYVPDPNLAGQRIFWSNVNLVLFYFGDCSIDSLCRDQILQNIILTIPFGFGVSFIAQLKARDFIWLSLAVGLGFEVTQFVVSQGGFHSLDVNDVMLNTAGVLLGYGCFRVFGWLYIIGMQFFKIKPRWLFAYIYDAVSDEGLKVRRLKS